MAAAAKRFRPDVLGISDTGISREPLLRQVEAMRSGLLLLEAPPGFGKTYALAQCCDQALRARHTVAWISLRVPDRAVAVFASRIFEALREAGLRGLPGEFSSTDGREPDVELTSVLSTLIRSMTAHGRRILLMLDDYQEIEGSQAEGLLTQLFEQFPANVLIGLASRRVCPILPSRLLLQGRVHRVAARSLLFSKTEARELFGRSVGALQLNSLYALTEGWPAALKMAQLCLPQWRRRNTDIESVPEFNRLIGEYCRKEILQSLDPESLALLTDCSISEALRPELCDAIRVSGNSSRTLARLATHETFMEADDGAPGTWRVPRLLRAILARRAAERGSEWMTTAHVRAAEYFETLNNTREAIRHYMDAGKPALAATALEHAAPLVMISALGDEGGQELLDLIPHSQVQSFPRLALFEAFLANKRGMLDEAQMMLAELASRTENFTKDRPGGSDALLKAEALCLDLLVKLYAHSRAEREYLRAVEEQVAVIGKHEARLATFPHIALGVLYECRGDLQVAESHFIQCQKITASERAPWMIMWLRFHGGTIALARGQLMEARYQLQTSSKLSRSDSRGSPTLRALAKLPLAEIYYETNSLVEAQTKLGEGLYTAEHVEGWFGPYAALYETAMMLHWHAGRIDQIEPLLARAFALQRVRLVLERFLKILQLRFELLQGRLDAAEAIVRTAQFTEIWNADSFQDRFAHREWDLLGHCLAVLAIEQAERTRATQTANQLERGDLAGAMHIVDRLERVSRLSGRMRTVVRALILRAIIVFRQGDAKPAVAHMLRALELAQPLGYCRVFLDEGHRVLPVLEAVRESAGVPAHISSYARTLLDELRTKTDTEPTASDIVLSQRELDVIRELSSGHSNKLIARKLGLAVPTVKFHLQNVFQKLSVRRRAAAVAEAHRRGWIS